MKKKKELILLQIIEGIKQGKTPIKISKELEMNKQTFQYYLRQLKKNGNIIKEGYGVWKVLKEVSKVPKVRSIKKQIRGHAFRWRVRFNQKIDWKRRLDNSKLKYQLVGLSKTTPRVILNDKKIWLTKSGLFIYEPKSFFSNSSFSSKGQAVWELDKTIKVLGRHLKIDLNHYTFTTSREHYGLIKNELAKQYNDKGEKLYISDDKGVWMWIDDSHSLAELESNEVKLNRKIQNWYNDMKKHNFDVTPSFLLQSINQVTNNQLMFNENFISHVEAIKTLSSEVKRLGEIITKLEDANRNK